MGTYVKKIRWQFLVSMGRWQLHAAKRQHRGRQSPCFSCLMWEAEERCSAWEETERRISLTPHGERQLTTGRDGQYLKTYGTKTLGGKKKDCPHGKTNLSSTRHLEALQILKREMYIKACVYACRYTCQCMYGYIGPLYSCFDDSTLKLNNYFLSSQVSMEPSVKIRVPHNGPKSDYSTFDLSILFLYL